MAGAGECGLSRPQSKPCNLEMWFQRPATALAKKAGHQPSIVGDVFHFGSSSSPGRN